MTENGKHQQPEKCDEPMDELGYPIFRQTHLDMEKPTVSLLHQQ